MNISVIIPAYNDKTLKTCLEHITACDTYGIAREILVVDNNSAEWVKKCIEQFPVHYVQEKKQGSYAARNAGIRNATGSILAFCDADCFVTRDWLQIIAQTFQDSDVDGAMGFSRGVGNSPVARFEQRMYEENIARFTETPRLERIDTRNVAIRRRVIEKVGLFNSALKFGGDWEYGARMHANNCHIIFEPRMIVDHAHPTKLRALLHKRIRQNIGNMKILSLHNETFLQKYFAPLYTVATIKPAMRRLRILFYTIFSWIFFPMAQYAICFFSERIGYFFFKAANVLAIRLGQLKGLQKQQ